jgi:hypothetical protein
MTNHDIIGSMILKSAEPEPEPEPGAGVGHFKRFVVAPETIATYSAYSTFTPFPNLKQATFAIGFRVTPDIGTGIPFRMRLETYDSATNRGAGFSFGTEVIDLNGFVSNRIIANTDDVSYGFPTGCYIKTGAYSATGVQYFDINFASKQIQPGVVYWMEFTCRDDVSTDFASGNSCIRMNGKKFGQHNVQILGGGDYNDKMVFNFYNDNTAAAMQVDIFNILGSFSDVITGTDGMELTEPLVNYNDWGTPTAENGRFHTPLDPSVFQLNWNSSTDPYLNIGSAGGTFVPGSGSPPIEIVQEEMFLHQTKEGEDWIVKIEDELTTTNRFFQLHFSQSVGSNTQNFVVAITECIGAPGNEFHPFTGYSGVSQTSMLVGTGLGGNWNDAETVYCGSSKGENQKLSTAFSTPYKQKILQSAWTGASYLRTYTENKIVHAIASRVEPNINYYVKGSNLTLLMGSNETKFDRRILYYAVYDQNLINAHPEIDWWGGLVLNEYFFKPGSYEVTDDLVNAIPGIQPSIVCYNARQVRGLGSERHSLPTYQQKITSGVQKYPATAYTDYNNIDFFATDLKVTGKFTASQ